MSLHGLPPVEPLPTYITTILLLPAMFHHMPLQQDSVKEFCIANITFYTLLLHMRSSYMVTHKGVSCKKFSTIRAFVASVMGDDQMFLPFVLRSERLGALGTFSSFNAVCPSHMHVQTRWYITLSSANCTFETPSSVMTPNVNTQILIPTECLAAVNANDVIVCMFNVHMFKKSSEEAEYLAWTVWADHVVFNQPIRLKTRCYRLVVLRIVFHD